MLGRWDPKRREGYVGWCNNGQQDRDPGGDRVSHVLSNCRVMSTEYLVRRIRTEHPAAIMPMPTYRVICSSPRLSLQDAHPLVTASRSAITSLPSAICLLPSAICPLLLVIITGVEYSPVRLAISYTTSPESS